MIMNTPESRIHKRSTIAGMFGNIMEWYDFAVFGFLAPYLSSVFFPADDTLAGLIKTYGVFAAGYLMRPLGGLLFGHIGDRYGRKQALQISIYMMAVPTVLVGLLPTHAEIGTNAAVLLIALRLIQGVSVGGEFMGSVSYLVENAAPNRRGFNGSLAFGSAVLGILSGSAVVTLLSAQMSHDVIVNWGWRIPFLAGVLILIIGVWLRRNMIESPAFTELKDQDKLDRNPLGTVLKEMPLRVLQLIVIILLLGTSFYMLFVWMPTYLSQIIEPPVPHALRVNTLSMLLLVVMIPVAGWLSDQWGRKKMLITASALMAISAYPLFLMIEHANMVAALAIQCTFALMVAVVQGSTPTLMVEMFPARNRYCATGLGYNVTLALFGGTAPLFCTWLIEKSGNVASPGIYLAIVATLTCIGTATLKKLPEVR